MGPDTYTVDEIDSFNVPQLKKILKDMGVRTSTAGKDWRRPKLRQEVIARAGPSQGSGANSTPPAPPTGGSGTAQQTQPTQPAPPTGGSGAGAGGSGAPAPPTGGSGANPTTTATQQPQQANTGGGAAWAEVMAFFAGCGIGQQEGALFATMEGIQQPSDLLQYNHSEIPRTITAHNKALSGSGRSHLCITGNLPLKRLQALVYRIRTWHLAGESFTTAEWSTTDQVLQATTELDQVTTEEDNTDSTNIGFTNISEATFTSNPEQALDIIKARCRMVGSFHRHGVKLLYLLREKSWTLPDNPTIEDKLHHKIDLLHPTSMRDNQVLWRMIEEWSRDKSWWHTVRPFQKTQDGRGAYLALVSLYLGQDRINARIQIERNRISDDLTVGLYYEGEIKGTWQPYFSGLDSSYAYLQEYGGETYSANSRVLRLLRGIKGDALSKEGIRFAIQHIKVSPNLKNDYQAAGAYMATQVQDAYAGSQTKQSAIRNSVVSEANTQDNPGGGSRNRDRTPWLSSPNYKYNGATAHSSVNGISTKDNEIWKSYRRNQFTGDLKSYILNRRRWQEYHGTAEQNGRTGRDSRGDGGRGNGKRKPDEREVKEAAIKLLNQWSKEKADDSSDDSPSPKKQVKRESDDSPFAGLVGKNVDKKKKKN